MKKGTDLRTGITIMLVTAIIGTIAFCAGFVLGFQKAKEYAIKPIFPETQEVDEWQKK